MSKKIVIDPVTRIEGHAKIVITLDENEAVDDVKFHVVEFRGFEKFVEGRHLSEMASITSRICGICPVSHHLAAAKACDRLMGVEPPRPASMLRSLMHKGQVVQSHALSFFHLSSPDFLLGFDADPGTRNIVGLIGANPELARKGIALRKFGQEVIEAVGGRKIHPDVCVPGGMNRALGQEDRDRLRKGLDGAMDNAQAGLDTLRDYIEKNAGMVNSFATFPTSYMGTVNEDGGLALYDGWLRLVDRNGESLEDFWSPQDYLSIIGEVTEDWSYLKFPFYRPQGYPEGTYRVGPLARLNAVSSVEGERASEAWKAFRDINGGKPVEGSMYYHYARMVEIMYSLEKIARLLDDPEIVSTDLITPSSEVDGEGVGCIEAPRGTLFHHYWANETGAIEKANFIVATGHNNISMNRAVLDVAKQYVKGAELREGMLNRVEAAIRCYDPCLSCSTHAVGQMPIRLELRGPGGELLDEAVRGA